MHILINALAASSGGGLTYLRNVVPQLAAHRDVRATVLVSSLREELAGFPNVSMLEERAVASAARRFWREQWIIPKLIASTGAEVLISTGNFAICNSPVPQILLSRNALYTSTDFHRDLRERGDYRLWLDTHFKAALARASIRRADCTIAPSAAFAAELRSWTGLPIRAIRHGLDHNMFRQNGSPLPQNVLARLDDTKNDFRLLYVSHFNYYRNFRTLIAALPDLKERLGTRKLKLLLTCTFNCANKPGSYHPHTEVSLLHRLGVTEEVIQLGSVPYDLLHKLYAACDLYVTSAYAESFAHPLVEAMACGLPIVASDLPVHREVCRDAAVYFARFSPRELAQRVGDLACSPELRRAMAQRGLQRAEAFSWRKHVEELIAIAESLVRKRTPDGVSSLKHPAPQ